MIFITSHLIGMFDWKNEVIFTRVVLFDHSFKGLESQHDVFYDSHADRSHVFSPWTESFSPHARLN